jgi:hypothetical protein
MNPRADDEAALRQRIAVALPLGATRPQVEAWLKAQRYPYGAILDGRTHKPLGFVSLQSYTDWLGENGDTDMEFYFDDDGKLKEETVNIHNISP